MSIIQLIELFWKAVKGYIRAEFSFLSHDALHIHIGLSIFILAYFIFRNYRGKGIISVLCVFLLVLINEYFDKEDWLLWPQVINWREPLKDVVNTILWPIVLCVVLSRTRRGGKS